MNLEIGQWKLHKWKHKCKDQTSQNFGQYPKSMLQMIGITEGAEENGAEEIFEEIITENFSKLMTDTNLRF